MNLTDHATVARIVLNLSNLTDLMETKIDKGILLINRSTYSTFDLFDFNSCHYIILSN